MVVTRDGAPAAGVGVTWSTGSGSLDPTSDQTDGDGLSTSTWTLGGTPGAMAATASVTNATGSPVTFTATATTDDGRPSGTIVQVLSELTTEFGPEDITVLVGTTVTWVWGTACGRPQRRPRQRHDAGQQRRLGQCTTHLPLHLQRTSGTFHYHCQAHGNVGGVGMSGTVSVVTTLP